MELEIDFVGIYEIDPEKYNTSRSGRLSSAMMTLNYICRRSVHHKVQLVMNKAGLSEKLPKMLDRLSEQISCEHTDPNLKSTGDLFACFCLMQDVSLNWTHENPGRKELIHNNVDLLKLRKGLRHSVYSFVRVCSWSVGMHV